MLCVVNIEFTSRCYKTFVIDNLFEFTGFVIHHNDGGFLLFAVPYGEPDFVTGLVVFRLHDTFRSFTQISPLGDGSV